MTSIKSIIVRYFAAIVVLLIVVFAFLYLPVLHSVRSDIAARLNLSEGGLAAALFLILIGFYLLMGWRLKGMISDSMGEFVKRAESNLLNVSVGPKPKLIEANRIGIVIESKVSRIRELENLLDDAEGNIESAEKDATRLEDELAELESNSVEMEKTIEELKLQARKLQELNTHLEQSLEEERRNKIGVEVEKRTDEIYLQMEKAVEASAMRSLWLPKVIQEIKSPCTVIKNLAVRLQSKWEDLSFSRIREDLFEIQRQSEVQAKVLDKALAAEPKLHVSTQESGFSLKPCLENLMNGSSESAAVLGLDYNLGDGLKLDLDRDHFERLCRLLLGKAASRIVEGEVVLHADSSMGRLALKLESKGSLNFDYDLEIGDAESLASGLNGRIVVDEGEERSITVYFKCSARAESGNGIRTF